MEMRRERHGDCKQHDTSVIWPLWVRLRRSAICTVCRGQCAVVMRRAGSCVGGVFGPLNGGLGCK
jgi:hypothetical protein